MPGKVSYHATHVRRAKEFEVEIESGRREGRERRGVELGARGWCEGGLFGEDEGWKGLSNGIDERGGRRCRRGDGGDSDQDDVGREESGGKGDGVDLDGWRP